MLAPFKSEYCGAMNIYSNAKLECVVECINFDHVSCVFMQRIVQFPLISYTSSMFRACIIVNTMCKHSASSQYLILKHFYKCMYFCAKGCNFCWVYEESLTNSDNDVLSLMVNNIRWSSISDSHHILDAGTWLRGDHMGKC